jgi:hypothetical protein
MHSLAESYTNVRHLDADLTLDKHILSDIFKKTD